MPDAMTAQRYCVVLRSTPAAAARRRSAILAKGIPMTFLDFKTATLIPALRSFAGVAVLGSAVIALPLAAQSTDAAAPRATHAAAHHAGAKHESVEQRISALHADLKITADQEAAWSAVAQTMRDNHAAMEKLVAEGSQTTAQTVSAVDDLRRYEKFTQAHVDGLKSLIESFSTLYDSMPQSQKLVADHVFQSFGHRAPPPKS
jgi:hypothetical protein